VANTAQAKKRARQSEQSRARNASRRSMVRTYLKKVIKALDSGNKDLAQQAYKEAVPMLDKAVGKGIIHKNKAARHKSRLNARLKKLVLGEAAA
jgi:small subunit ribosomal protein S20